MQAKIDFLKFVLVLLLNFLGPGEKGITFKANGLRIFVVSLVLLGFIWPTRAYSLIYYWQKKPQSERLVIEFDHKPPLSPKVVRTNYQELSVVLPSQFLAKEELPVPVDLSFSRLIKRVVINKRKFLIQTKTNSFGFVSFWDKQTNKLYLDIFFDPLGKKWKPASLKRKPIQKKKSKRPLVNKPSIKKLTNKKTSKRAKVKKMTTSKSSGSKKQKKVTPPKTKSSSSQIRQSISLKEQSPKKNVSQAKPTAPKPFSQAQKIKPYQIRSKIYHVDITHAVVLRPEKAFVPNAVESNATDFNKQTSSKASQNQTNSIPTPKNTTPQSSSKRESPPATSPANVSPTQPQANATAKQNVPDFRTILVTAKASMLNGDLNASLQSIEGIVNHPLLPDNLKEEVYYLYADLLFDVYKNQLPQGFDKIVDAYNRAMNYNPKSPRVPEALLKLGYLNLKVGNLPEARGYFNLLRQKYPHDLNVPLTYFYWGEYYFRHGKYQKAADQFQTFITKYPDHKLAKQAAIYLTKSLLKLEYYKQALEIVKFIENRWPRYYLRQPDFLLDAAYLYFKNKVLDKAKDRYLLYYNLLPEGKDLDMVLARLGDIYLLQNQKKAAKEMYELAVKKFPDQDGGLIAAMRLAEEGIYDQPSIKEMFSIFDRPYNLRPEKIYTRIIQKHPNSSLAPLAQLKLAMWFLFNHKPEQALDVLKDFFSHPKAHLLDKAKEVGLEIFKQLLSRYLAENNYTAPLRLLKKYPFLAQMIDRLDPEHRLLLATAYLKNNKLARGLELLSPLLKADNKQKVTQDALALALSLYLKLENWPKIIELGEKVKNWPLSKKQKQRVLFALALAYEKLNKPEKSIPLWKKIAADISAPPKMRAYAMYFLAIYSAKQRKWEDVYIFGQNALSLFLEKFKHSEQEKIRTCLRLLIQATKITGRTQEALAWAIELKKYTPLDSPVWPSVQYDLAELYKANQDVKNWQKALQELIAQKPQSLYAKMAKEELKIIELEKKAQKYAPTQP